MTLNIQKRRMNKNSVVPKTNSAEVSKDMILTVQINALTPEKIGLAELKNGYTLLIPNARLGDKVEVKIEKVFVGKLKYATATVLKTLTQNSSQPNLLEKGNTSFKVTVSKDGPKGSGLVRLDDNFILIIPGAKAGQEVSVQLTRIKGNYGFAKIMEATPNQFSNSRSLEFSNLMENTSDLKLGTKFHIILPPQTKFFAKYGLIKIKETLVFVKMALGAEVGKQVKIQVVKVTPKFAIAKVIKVAPLSENQKQTMVKQSVQEMIETGLHFGEKAIRCNANMRKFIWLKKKGKYQNRPFLRKGRHIINVLKTRRCLNKSLKQLAKYAAKGKTFLFVGTKKSAASLIARTAMLSQTAFFVNTRWLGGMLTNWKTILKSISQIRPILKEKQRIIKTILQKRQQIKTYLIEKVNFLRQKTLKLMLKGKQLILKIQQNKNDFFTKSQTLLAKKNEILTKNQLLIQNYTNLMLKQESLNQQSLMIQAQANQLILQKQNLSSELVNSYQKLQNLKHLFLIGQELLKLKTKFEKDGKVVWTIPYVQFTKLVKQDQYGDSLVPNPSKEILNQIIHVLKTSDFTSVNRGTNMSGVNFAKSEENVQNAANHQESKVVIFSKILEKFLAMFPVLEFSFKAVLDRIQNITTLLNSIDENLKLLKTKTLTLEELKAGIQQQLNMMETKFVGQKELLKNLKIQLKRLGAEQRLLRFLPRLRYLQTSRTKMIETIEILMKKFVDPKMAYPVDEIYDQKLKSTSKKIAATRKQKWQRLEKYFGGVTKMSKMTKKQLSQNVGIIVGQKEELNAVYECQKLGIKMFTVVDTNCNPRLSDHIIPANDDSRNSIKFILGKMLTYMRLAQKLRQKILSRRIQKKVKTI